MTCRYCGQVIDDSTSHCHGCGTAVDHSADQRHDPKVDRRIKGLKFVVTVLAVAVGLVIIIFRTPYPPQPKFGFTGAWRSFSVFGVEERPLPPSKEVWADYANWIPATNKNSSRVYLAHLGGVDRQADFRVSTNSGDTPMGAQKWTHVDFTYNDPSNGTYQISWSLRGEHDVRFLRFDERYRLYQLELWGETNESPPRLVIRGIEGIKPNH